MNNKKWRKWCMFVSLSLFNNNYGLPVLTKDTKCPNQDFFVWLVDLQTTCAKYGLETWFTPNDDIRNVCSTWSMVELKTRFETWITRNEVNGVSFLNFFYLINLPALTTNTKCPNQLFHVWFVYLQTICAKYGLETWFSPNNDIRKCMLYMMHGSNKNAFWDMNNKRGRKWCTFFHLSYLITLIVYLCSQWTSNIQIKYFMVDWSIYWLFVLNRGCKLESSK
jgi:hypothetical protein